MYPVIIGAIQIKFRFPNGKNTTKVFLEDMSVNSVYKYVLQTLKADGKLLRVLGRS